MEDNRNKEIEAYSVLKVAIRKSGFRIANGELYIKARDIYKAINDAEAIRRAVQPIDAGLGMYACPVCKEAIFKKCNYCARCGNKLLWERKNVSYPLNYVACLRLLEACLDNGLALRDPKDRNRMIVFVEDDEQMYSENIMTVAGKLVNDIDGQKYIVSLLEENHIRIDFIECTERR